MTSALQCGTVDLSVQDWLLFYRHRSDERLSEPGRDRVRISDETFATFQFPYPYDR